MATLLLDRRRADGARSRRGRSWRSWPDESAHERLVQGLHTPADVVAAEAADRARAACTTSARARAARLVHVEDPYLRARAAVSLGRLRDLRAVPR
jgi:hypothetical protein